MTFVTRQMKIDRSPNHHTILVKGVDVRVYNFTSKTPCSSQKQSFARAYEMLASMCQHFLTCAAKNPLRVRHPDAVKQQMPGLIEDRMVFWGYTDLHLSSYEGHV